VKVDIENNSIGFKYLSSKLIIAEKVKEKGGEKLKHKLFAVAALTVLMLALPAFSFEPPPEGIPPCYIYITPQELKLTGPCVESHTFEAEVSVWDIRMLYAWDIAVYWDTTYLNLTDYEIKVPPGWGVDDYQVLIDKVENGLDPYKRLHFAVTYVGTYPEGLGFNGSCPLLNMFFHVIYEPCWPDCKETGIWFSGVFPPTLSTGCGHEIICEEHESTIWLNPGRPNMEVLFSDTFDLEAKKAQGWYEDQVITAYVWVSNATKLYDIHFKLWWNTELIHVDLQQITINEEAFPMPWNYLHQEIGEDTWDYLWFEIARPCTKPPLKGTFWIVKLDFKVSCVTDEWLNPINASCPIELGPNPEYTYLSTLCREYNAENGLVLSDADYYWTPIPMDFDQNGHVGVEDIMWIMDYYGMSDTSYDLNDDGVVDIYDVVMVSKAYCHSTPPVLADP